jgi:hypothetical protein
MPGICIYIQTVWPHLPLPGQCLEQELDIFKAAIAKQWKRTRIYDVDSFLVARTAQNA